MSEPYRPGTSVGDIVRRGLSQQSQSLVGKGKERLVAVRDRRADPRVTFVQRRLAAVRDKIGERRGDGGYRRADQIVTFGTRSGVTVNGKPELISVLKEYCCYHRGEEAVATLSRSRIIRLV